MVAGHRAFDPLSSRLAADAGRLARAELRIGGAQYALAQKAIRAYTGLREYGRTVDGVHIPYLRGGRGPLMLLVHGFGDRKESWGPLAAVLCRRFELLIPDMPGFGGTSAVSSERIEAPSQARHLSRFLDALGIGGLHVLGQSMGGLIAARFAADYHFRARTLTLVSAAGPAHLAPDLQALVDVGRNPLIVRSFEDFEALTALCFEKPLAYPRPMRRYLAALWSIRADELEGHFDRLMNPAPGEEPPALLPGIRAPTLVVYGDCERIVHPDNAAIYHDGIPGARLVVLPNVGHAPHHEATVALGRMVREHVAASVLPGV